MSDLEQVLKSKKIRDEFHVIWALIHEEPLHIDFFARTCDRILFELGELKSCTFDDLHNTWRTCVFSDRAETDFNATYERFQRTIVTEAGWHWRSEPLQLNLVWDFSAPHATSQIVWN